MKRLWFNLIIFLGCFVLLITVLGAVLIMAPGMELLGVMYIRSTSGSVEETKLVKDATAYKQISVESDNIPVYIEFVQSYTLAVSFVESYDGFAKAGGTPTVDVEITTNGVEIKSHEYDSFLFNSRSEGSGLFVKVPLYYHNKLVVNSQKSPVSFTGLEGSVSDIFVTTEGAVNFNNNLSFKNLELTIGNKNAVVSDSVNIDGYIIAKSDRGNITLPDGFKGNISFKSKSGDLIMASCNDINYSSKTGEIKPNGKFVPVVAGNAVIETNGNVTLKSVGGKCSITSNNGDVTYGTESSVNENQLSITTTGGDINLLGTYTNEKNLITTTSGDIVVDKIQNTVLNSKYGNISVKTADNVTISTKSGDVKAESVLSHSTITTNNGDVTLGISAKSNHISGATIVTVGGDIKIYNASGETYNLKTNSGDIHFAQSKSGKVNLNIDSKSGDLTLLNMSGSVVANTKGEVYVDVFKMNGKIDISAHNRKVTMIVRDTCYLDLASRKNIASAPELKEKAKTYYTVPLSGEHENSTIKVTTKNGKIAITKM